MFGRKSRQVLERLQDVSAQMERLTATLDRLQETTGHSARINIEHLDISEAFLNELVFRLESLDIDELSGSLNVGNNFSPTVKQEHQAAAEQPEKNRSLAREGLARHASDETREVSDVTLKNGSTLKTTEKGYLLSL